MMVERILRGMTGFFVLLSTVLAYYVDERWIWFTVFIGINLLQSAFTNWCPTMTILRKCGVCD